MLGCCYLYNTLTENILNSRAVICSSSMAVIIY
jgi:hypothetical protein